MHYASVYLNIYSKEIRHCLLYSGCSADVNTFKKNMPKFSLHGSRYVYGSLAQQ